MYDDTGSCGYTYPLDQHFRPGVLDILTFRVSMDDNSYYFNLGFRDLVNPGWHPEYGFQLTFVAIVLGDDSSDLRDIGANARYGSVPASRVIYVGGGLRVENEAGQTLAQFTPRFASDALGDTSSAEISFSLPKKYFPARSSAWSWLVLVGAQDDHGGAGMGEFRTVKAVAEQWAGGGNKCNGPNIYDILRVE